MAKRKRRDGPLNNREKSELWAKVDSEGFGYYMFSYGPDLDALERLGFDRDELESFVEFGQRLESAIMELENAFDGDEYE